MSRSGGGGGPTEPELQTEAVFVSIVIAAVSATALPDVVVLVVSVMLAIARMFPTNSVPVPRVAEVPTCQKTFDPQFGAVPTTTMDELLAVVSVLPIWKIQGPAPVRDSVPVS